MNCEEIREAIKAYCIKRAGEKVSVGELMKGKKRMLDLGCGDGKKLGSFVELPKSRKFGLDVYVPKNIETLKFNFVQSKLPELPFKENAFDVVTCNHVVEHLNEREGKRLMHEAARVMEKNGQLLVVTPNSMGLTKIVHGVLDWIGIYGLFEKLFLAREKLSRKEFEDKHSHGLRWKHEHEYSFGEIVEMARGKFAVERKGAFTLQWHSFTKLLWLMNLVLPWKCIEGFLDLVDNLFDFPLLWKFKAQFFVVMRKL